jgi:hypothetical protein
MTLQEFDLLCAAPDVDDLDRRQEELLRTLEFCVEMEVMYGLSPERS